MLLTKTPVPVPSTVLVVRAIVGLVVVLHTTPRAVTELVPAAVMFPPLVAVVVVMLLVAVVVKTGNKLFITVCKVVIWVCNCATSASI